ncbi:MAG: FCD domain-containing protein [Actinomycetota bacterium]
MEHGNRSRRFDLLDTVSIPIRATRLADQIAAGLRGWIVNEAAPGDFLPSERDLIDRFHASRPTVREAMRILEAEGLIEIKRGVNGGAVVRKPDIYGLATAVGTFLQRIGVTLQEVFNLRLLLEPEAARRAALSPERGEVARVLGAVLDAEQQAVQEPEPAGVSRRVVEFHNAVLALANDRALATFGELLETVVVQQNARSLSGADDPHRWSADAHAAHRRIAAAIKRGDADAAARLTRKHLEAAAQMIIGEEIDLTVDVVSGIVASDINPDGRRAPSTVS